MTWQSKLADRSHPLWMILAMSIIIGVRVGFCSEISWDELRDTLTTVLAVIGTTRLLPAVCGTNKEKK